MQEWTYGSLHETFYNNWKIYTKNSKLLLFWGIRPQLYTDNSEIWHSGINLGFNQSCKKCYKHRPKATPHSGQFMTLLEASPTSMH